MGYEPDYSRSSYFKNCSTRVKDLPRDAAGNILPSAHAMRQRGIAPEDVEDGKIVYLPVTPKNRLG